MNKVWTSEYDEGVPESISPSDHTSIGEMMEASFELFSDQPSFTSMNKSLSYRSLEVLSRQLGAFLTSEVKLKKGDRIAIMMPNSLPYPVTLCAALRSGFVVVNVNPLYTDRELLHQLKDSGAKAIVIMENFAHVFERVMTQVPIESVIITSVGDLLGSPKSLLVNFVVRNIKRMVPNYSIPGSVRFMEALKRGQQHSWNKCDVNADDVAFLQYTGGTTGLSKGAILTHGNILANVQQSYLWIKKYVEVGKEVIITALPLYHIFSLTANFLTFFRIGGHNILILNPRDLRSFIKTLKSVHFTAFTGVNTLFNGLLSKEDFKRVNFSSLKLTLGGGMAVQKTVADLWKEVTGCSLIQAYGLTETSPAVSINPMDQKDFNGSIGLALPSTEIRVQNECGQELGFDELGELCIKGPQVMRGYWNNPEETKKAFTEDGWFKTGDVARVDEKGFIHLVDRIKDMILVSGFNVYPNEVEDVLSAYPGVHECAVVAVDDEKSGEAVKAFIVRNDSSVNGEKLRIYCKGHLTAYKIPRYFEFCEELPKTNVGKILRRALREKAPS